MLPSLKIAMPVTASSGFSCVPESATMGTTGAVMPSSCLVMYSMSMVAREWPAARSFIIMRVRVMPESCSGSGSARSTSLASPSLMTSQTSRRSSSSRMNTSRWVKRSFSACSLLTTSTWLCCK